MHAMHHPKKHQDDERRNQELNLGEAGEDGVSGGWVGVTVATAVGEARASIWWRHESQTSAKPWMRWAGGAAAEPCSAKPPWH